MKKVLGLMCLGLLMFSGTTFASQLPYTAAGMKVPLTSPANRLVDKNGGFAAQMYWSKEPHTRKLENMIVSASFKDGALSVKDSENLLYSFDELIDDGMKIVTLQKTPYAELKLKPMDYGKLSSEIQKYDAGMLFYIDNQTKGEVGLHVFLRDTADGKIFGHYTARAAYNEEKGLEDKKSALKRSITTFAREFKKFRNGERAVSETIYDIQ